MHAAGRFLIRFLTLALAPGLAIPHHNTAAVFDLEKEVHIEGTVTRYQYRNPHIYFFVRDNDGVEWRIEAGPTALMNRFGWSAETLKEGDSIEMVGSPSRRAGKPSAFLGTASVDGRPLPSFGDGSSFRRLTEDNSDRDVRAGSLAGTWVTVLTADSQWIDYPAESLPLNDGGRQSIESFDENTMSPALTCTPLTAPATMMIPDTKRIEITESYVSIGSEFNGATRVIQIAESTAPESPTIQGHSVGSLDGNTLRVETTAFEAHRAGIAFGLASGLGKRLVEEFTLSEDARGLTYRFTLTDPEFLAEPFSGESYWAYRPDQPFEILPCDLENSRLFLDE